MRLNTYSVNIVGEIKAHTHLTSDMNASRFNIPGCDGPSGFAFISKGRCSLTTELSLIFRFQHHVAQNSDEISANKIQPF